MGYGVVLAVPRVRRALRDERYRMPPRSAARTALAVFGLWHVLPALDMARRNVALRRHRGRTALLTVVVTVVVTTLAGVLPAELRRRTGSVLAPVGLYWAVNGLGMLAAARAWRTDGEGPAPPRRVAPPAGANYGSDEAGD
ncbi:MAG TPA: CPBP family glutamic-type intramembrane protease [Jiangellales bacterium]|nr:CPBP family glutamic-type intramembrane protease [Jiangellales bacterium]